PGHFAGVLQIVNKLFNLLQPNYAVFGEKDYQQCLLIKKMTADFLMPIQIITAPIAREANGLAMSSRNQYLTANERELAPHLYRVLSTVKERLEKAERDYQQLQSDAVAELKRAGFEPDYVAIRQAANLEVPDSNESEFVVLAAAQLGKARLIDNIRVST
ncbi:MAG: pantoate--beta-alanine ligase, partial [Pseudomonadota bacterium]